ncbi:variant surface glycoprotein [Trypanosoma brucei equiperdum]|uniref:Variant surface glycoprotein n=1 Tax=Trypanosoma brucei equiperdum TaxID=630700 RepID=A0A3L6LCC0_9TRYP|nr:variant surface glycoprotein [Trypanosoma brucei equiperdum]
METTPVLQATIFLLCVVVNIGQAAISGAENEEDFATLCMLINIAKRTITIPTAESDADALTANIGAINMSIAEDGLQARVDKAKKIDQLTGEAASAAKGLENKWDFLQQAKQQIEGNKKTEYERWKQAQLTTKARRQISMVAEEAYKLHGKLMTVRTKLNASKINTKLKEALYGPKMTAAEVKTTSDSREAACGPTNGAGGADAGNSLAMDLLCICAKDNSDVSGHKACGQDWSSGSDAAKTWDPAQDASAIIADLLAKCQLQTTPATLSTAELQTAMTKFLNRISIARGSNGAKRRTLGTLESTGAGQCTGYQDSTNGPCVQYKAAHLTGPAISIPWYVTLKGAHDNWEAATEAESEIKGLEAQLKALNLTANSLQLETQTAHKKEVAVQTEAETLTSKKKCEAIQAAADCRKNENCICHAKGENRVASGTRSLNTNSRNHNKLCRNRH